MEQVGLVSPTTPRAVSAIGSFDKSADCRAVGRDRKAERRAGVQSVASMARAAAMGSSARLIGRPMTSTLAPASRAARGVTARF